MIRVRHLDTAGTGPPQVTTDKHPHRDSTKTQKRDRTPHVTSKPVKSHKCFVLQCISSSLNHQPKGPSFPNLSHQTFFAQFATSAERSRRRSTRSSFTASFLVLLLRSLSALWSAEGLGSWEGECGKENSGRRRRVARSSGRRASGRMTNLPKEGTRKREREEGT